MVVLPTPGGPHKIIDGKFPDSMATRKDFPSPKICFCPAISLTDLGLKYSAKGN